MALTPHEEREIHQIEESLLGSDPGFVARMSRTWRPHRKFLIAAPCLMVIAVVFGLFGPAGWSLAGLGATAFLLGWCLSRVDSFDLQLLVRRVLVLPGRLARAIWSVPRHIVRRRR